MFQRKTGIGATCIECKTTHGKDSYIGDSCAALGAGGMMPYRGQLALCHSDMSLLLSEPQLPTPCGVRLHLVAAASIQPHKHQGRFQQALIGSSFQEVYMKKEVNHYKSF